MHPDTLPFLHALYDSVQGWITLTAIHPDGKYPAPSRHIAVGDEAALASTLERLHRANQAGWGAYMSIATRKNNLGRWRRGGKDDLAYLPALFVDIDADPAVALPGLHSFSPAPSCLIASGRGIHGYWLTEPVTDFAMADSILRGLAYHFHADRTNVAQALRAPGSFNTKPTRGGALCHLIELFPDRRYSLDDFAGFAMASPAQQGKDPSKDFSRLKYSHDLNPTLVKGVADCLLSDYQGYLKTNGYIAALCPCGHCRDYSGCHSNFDVGRAVGMCFGRHGRLLLKDLCGLLRLDPTAYGGLYA